MTIAVKNIRPATSEEWDQIWEGCDYSTYFHSREWAEIWNVYTKGKTRLGPKLVLFSDGKKALLPLLYTSSLKGFSKDYISSFAGTYGGWISVDNLNENHAILLINFLTKKLETLSWRVNPYDKIDVKKFLINYKEDETYVFDLRDGFEIVWGEWKKRERHYVLKRIQKKGFSVRIASNWNDWLAYFQVYQETLLRWGDSATSNYRQELFEQMFKLKSPFIKLLLCLDQEKIISGVLIFYAKKHVVFWHSATLEEYYKFSPTTLLKYEILKDACQKGFAWFDLNPSGNHEGVKAYKKNLGAKPLLCPVVFRRNKNILKQVLNELYKIRGKIKV